MRNASHSKFRNYGLILFMALIGVTLMMSTALWQLTPAEKTALCVEYTTSGHLWLLETAQAASVAGQLSAEGIRQLRRPVTGDEQIRPCSRPELSPGLR